MKGRVTGGLLGMNDGPWPWSWPEELFRGLGSGSSRSSGDVCWF